MNKKSEVLAYLDKLAPVEKKALGELRGLILKIAPIMDERLSRGVPFFYYQGKRAVGFRSSKGHLSFFIMEGNVLKNLRNELMKHDHSSTVIRFTAENPLSKQLIRKLVSARISEIEKNIVKSRRAT